MCELLELQVVDLFRVRIGPVRLGDLPEGRWRPLSPAEREALVRGG
jgi:23S rRNA pseudouridine2604 synthase